jgi:hypothetical protein
MREVEERELTIEEGAERQGGREREREICWLNVHTTTYLYSKPSPVSY